MQFTTSPSQQAGALLDRLRQTPMRRGALSKRACRIRPRIARAIAAQDVPASLAQGIAFQLAFKFHARDLGDETVWRAIGAQLREEVACLRDRVDMPERKIVRVLPKLSAAQIEEFLDELMKADRRIARTILHAAVDGADPLSMGRRYLAEYRLVARKLRDIDPRMARTLANATFTAAVPLHKAIEFQERFSLAMTRHQETPEIARIIARASYRAK
jgi:hypothetical protein